MRKINKFLTFMKCWCFFQFYWRQKQTLAKHFPIQLTTTISMDPSFYLRKLTIPEPLRKYSLPEHLQKLNDNIGLLKLKRRKKVRFLAFYIALINSKPTNCRIFKHSLLHKFLYTKITLRMRLCSVHTYTFCIKFQQAIGKE